MIKKGDLYYPTKAFQEKAWLKDKKIYKTASKDPIKFWENLAEEIYWQKKWTKVFSHSELSKEAKGKMRKKFSSHQPPFFKWFEGGKLNITENCLDRNLAKLKNKPALIWEPEPIKEKPIVLTYQELLKKVNKFANGLKRIGVKKGDRVGIYLPMIPEAAIAMLALARIGAVHTVVFSAFSSQALKARLQDTEAKVLITADGYYRRGKIVNLKQAADEGLKETKVEKVIVVKRAGSKIAWNKAKDVWYQDLVKKEKDVCQPETMDAEDLLFILYTSGSTGRPKGCVHTCGGYTVQAKFTGKWIFDFHPKDVFWCTADIGWVTGHTYGVYSPLLNGMPTIFYEGAPDFPVPDRWAQIVEKHKATIFYTAPTAIRMFEKLGTDLVRKHKFKTLRLLGSVGEPIDEAAWLWYFKEIGKERCPVVDTWWQTETGGILISSLPGIGPFKPAFTGFPFPGLKFDILDDKGKSCPIEKQGNLVLLPPFSPGLLRGVYKNPEKYLKTYWSQYGKKVYFTSDGAYKDKNGLIRIIGRMDDVIKMAGHRLTTGELEEAINLHPGITECAVVGVPDEIKGEAPVAFIVYEGAKDSQTIQKEVVGQIRKEIGPIALPKQIYLVKDLPKTRSGKIMRRILKKLFAGEELGDLSTLANPESVEAIKKTIKV
ncbi:MAG: acetate--CoA ligase [bacterium]